VSYYTIAVGIFRWSEKRFWRSTPRIIAALWNEYLRLTGQAEPEEIPSGEKIVMRGGKPYRVKKANEIGNIF